MTQQLPLFQPKSGGSSPFDLDPETVRLGREGTAKAREILRQAAARRQLAAAESSSRLAA